ncbi:Cadmium%2C zinc and cobalt-transporting ATPase [Roseburia hominis]|uniref:heavy metal translocating P-type ATPase n=1 Tax=Catenibacterium mitsuokai TaxID=100886 RepID=UPI0006C727F2|nr:heavy metal translocating P-type ATPase [Catenibacterium mitsuokai]CUO98548.1 Cadmium%2C zinc and cobalt-transporting ATPase [Catenibacterium mitsuokai]CUP66002.1 Cadmium%2C zinc and cobalt-transporting ATPase [Roseburia hominis]
MTKKQKNVLNRIIIAIVLLIVITVFKTIVPVPGYVEFILYLIPYFVIGHDILRKSIKNISHGQVFDENFLMAVATIGAMCLGEYLEGSAVMVFYQIGELFQSIAVGKSRKNIAALMDIRPDYANIMVDGEIEEVDPDDVEIGSEIIVNPGEKVPIDGIIVEGDTTLNTSALTGESVPRNAHCGDEIYSGSINMTARITVKTTKEFGESTVSKILDLVENSSMKKSKTENFITKFAKYYTPVVCYSALALAVIPPIVLTIMGQPAHVSDWIFRALTFLVISCPCALVISIPLSFFGGIGGASKNGILVKGSNYLETLSDVKYFVFDKTGTLTKGVFEVTDVVPAEGFNKYNLLEYAAYAESASTHPISVSLKKAYNQKIDNTLVDHIQEIAGHGVEADYNDHHILAGNAKLMKLKGVGYSAYTKAGTLVYVAVDDKYAGCIVISDIIKDHAKEAISGLKSLGAKETVMLTGDSASTADFVANTIGIDTVHSELLPADKVEEVEKLLANKSDKEKLAFVGDGINDAPVLSRADIGIAMGGLGSDAAIEAADVVLMDDDPLKISLAMKISTKTLKIVKQNIVFALAVKFICLVLGALGIANMWLAIFADVGVMILAVMNATRALTIHN